MAAIRIDLSAVVGQAPAWRGTYLGDSPLPLGAHDVARLRSEVGVTCIRLGLEPANLCNESAAEFYPSGFAYITEMLDACAHNQVACILDLHNAHGRRYGGDPRLWRESGFRVGFITLWQELARRTRGHPALAAWELLNEPEPPDNDYAVWNDLHQRATEAIRALDTHTPLVIDSIGYAKPQTFAGLALNGDPNTLYSFHNYQPGPFHCQKRRELADQSTYYYPGYIPRVRPGAGQALDFNLAPSAPEPARVWNRPQLIEEVAEPRAFRGRQHVPLFCGEFGCVSDVPDMTDLVYLMDEISIFQEQEIPWTMYNTMYRTNEAWWRSHFDCGIYISYPPEDQLFRYGRKIALLRFFCSLEGTVLRLEQPADGWLGIYGLKENNGTAHILLANKHREETRSLQLEFPSSFTTCTWRTLGKEDDDFVTQGQKKLENGQLNLKLAPLSLCWLMLPA
ncbi:MAG: glycoside hydrolase family 5 protein [Anaerolineae bacterium]